MVRQALDVRGVAADALPDPLAGRHRAGTEDDALIQNIDYAPTFLEMAGAEVPAEMQGRSLVPRLRTSTDGGPALWRDAIYYAYYENASVHAVPVHDGVRTDRYKLFRFPRTQEWQLFDLANDPAEMRSVHDDGAYSEVLASMQKRYRDLRDHYGVNSAVIPITRGDEDWWRDRLREKNAALKDAEAPHRLLFLGDSITESWDSVGREVFQEFYGERSAIGLGFSGDRTEHLLWRVRHAHPLPSEAEVAVVMIGTNNTGHLQQEPREVAEGVRVVIDALRERCPKCEVLLLGVFPRGRTPLDQGRLNNIAINDLLRTFAGDRVHYLDLAPVFVEADGTISEAIMPDALHLSVEGYRRWANALEPELRRLGFE